MLFLKGLVFGFILAGTVGPMWILCFRRTVAHGPRAGFISGMGIAVADGLYGAVAAFGLTAISGFLLKHSTWIGLLGSLRSVARPCDPEMQSTLLGGYQPDAGGRPRWSGCFDRAPARDVPADGTSVIQIRGAVARLELAAKRGSRGVLSELGPARVLAGDVTRGINVLERLLVEGQDSGTLTNLAAAYLTRAAREQSHADRIRALDYAAHAVALDPELIAEMTVRYARLVGRENVLVGNDCGFSSQAVYQPEVHPTVAWAKFQALAEGARLATKELWGT